MRELAHSEVVDDEQGYRGQVGDEGFAGARQCGVGEVFLQPVRLAIADATALLNRGVAEGLRMVSSDAWIRQLRRAASFLASRSPARIASMTARQVIPVRSLIT